MEDKKLGLVAEMKYLECLMDVHWEYEQWSASKELLERYKVLIDEYFDKITR